MTIRKPPRLRKGDLIALVSPASPIADPSRIERGARYLESLGYRTVLGKNILASHGYLAGTDEDRAADLNGFFANREVRAIFCIRGGYGTPRMLRLVDYAMIARHPKIFMGYSDITALSLAIWRNSGVVTFHGPMVGVDMADPMDAFTEELLWRTLTSTAKAGAIPFRDPRPVPLVDGTAAGRLLGGNLALIVSSMGTRYFPDLRGSLLFLEDIGEEPYRVDRMMHQLMNAGILRRSSGILLGQFTDCVPSDPTKPTFTTPEVFGQIASVAKRPWMAGVPFGHESVKMTIPVGIRARMDAGRGHLEYLEAAVR